MDATEFGKRLTQLRLQYDYTQAEIADKLYVSNKVVSKWECGRTVPDLQFLIQLAAIYGITLDELVDSEKQLQSIDIENKGKDDSQSKKLVIYFSRMIDILAIVLTLVVAAMWVFYFAGEIQGTLVPVMMICMTAGLAAVVSNALVQKSLSKKLYRRSQNENSNASTIYETVPDLLANPELLKKQRKTLDKISSAFIMAYGLLLFCLASLVFLTEWDKPEWLTSVYVIICAVILSYSAFTVYNSIRYGNYVRRIMSQSFEDGTPMRALQVNYEEFVKSHDKEWMKKYFPWIVCNCVFVLTGFFIGLLSVINHGDIWRIILGFALGIIGVASTVINAKVSWRFTREQGAKFLTDNKQQICDTLKFRRLDVKLYQLMLSRIVNGKGRPQI